MLMLTIVDTFDWWFILDLLERHLKYNKNKLKPRFSKVLDKG